MKQRVHVLAQKEVAKDRVFLDTHPEGVPLSLLGLCTDEMFNDFARRRQEMKSAGRGRDAACKALEQEMNDRVHELAQNFLTQHRTYLHEEYENVPLASLPLNSDKLFREMERELIQAQLDDTNAATTNTNSSSSSLSPSSPSYSSKARVTSLQDDLHARANEVAK